LKERLAYKDKIMNIVEKSFHEYTMINIKNMISVDIDPYIIPEIEVVNEKNNLSMKGFYEGKLPFDIKIFFDNSHEIKNKVINNTVLKEWIHNDVLSLY